MRHLILIIACLMLLSACALPKIPLLSSAPTSVPSSTPTEVLIPTTTATLPPPTATAILAVPTDTPSGPGPTATAIPAMTDAANPAKVMVFLSLVNDKGYQGDLIGCDDSLVPVEIAVPTYLDPVQASVQALLSIPTADYLGLYNGLHLSKLSFVSISYEGTRAVLRLSGDVLSGGFCDDPRIKMQIRKTVLFNKPNLTDVTVLVDGRDLEDVLSLQGK